MSRCVQTDSTISSIRLRLFLRKTRLYATGHILLRPEAVFFLEFTDVHPHFRQFACPFRTPHCRPRPPFQPGLFSKIATLQACVPRFCLFPLFLLQIMRSIPSSAIIDHLSLPRGSTHPLPVLRLLYLYILRSFGYCCFIPVCRSYLPLPKTRRVMGITSFSRY